MGEHDGTTTGRSFGTTRIRRFDGECWSDVEDVQIEERPVVLFLNGEEAGRFVMTPGDEKLWALGHLLCEGSIESRDDVISLEALAEVEGCRVDVRLRRILPVRPPRTCPVLWSTTPSVLTGGAAWLSEAPLYRRTGGAHVVALLSPTGEKLFRVEDVARHNAVDKAIGWGIERGIDFSGVLLVGSGRMPEDMVRKVRNAGIGLMASVSAATVQGIRTAREAGITLAGFVRNGRMNVYTVPERIRSSAGVL